MPYRAVTFINEGFYHIYNRGVEKRIIFEVEPDYQRFLEVLRYYQLGGPKPRFSTFKRFNQDLSKNPLIVEIVCFCLMPNHFHLLIRQLKTGGVQEFISKVSNSYTKYFNTKYKRVGPLFQAEFKAVSIESEEQLLHLSRYIHLNPYVAQIAENIENYPYSSFPEYLREKGGFCNTKPILDFFSSQGHYEEFVRDQKEYAKELASIKHLLQEEPQ